MSMLMTLFALRQVIARQEIAHSVLLSHLVETGTCPNFLQIYDIFLTRQKPREELWGSAQRRKPVEVLTEKLQASTISDEADSTDPSMNGADLHQYISMEYCDGGDLEDFISLQNDKLLPAENVAVPFFFQMTFSLYCARERFSLRHCDVKVCCVCCCMSCPVSDSSCVGLCCAAPQFLSKRRQRREVRQERHDRPVFRRTNML